MKVGIVGSEAAKFTALGEESAKNLIREILSQPDVTEAISGGCHLGGIDIWTDEIAHELNLPFTPFLPKTQSWEGGYKQRNLQIAHNSDIVYCITVDSFPPDYKGMRFPVCYHCVRNARQRISHIKSGGCWTMWEAVKIGKRGELKVIKNVA